MPQNPHEYTLRKHWENEDDFVEAVELIRQYGYKTKFKGNTYTQFNVLGHFYWSMGAPVPITIWSRLTKRLRGINTAGILKHDWKCPDDLPFMFKDWKEYRDHLLENLITDPSAKAIMLKQVATDTKNYLPEIQDKVCKYHIDMILKNDYHGTKADTFRAAHARFRVNTDRDHDKRAKELYRK